jgi:5-methylcytosine-specific restriction protein A
MTKRQTGFPPEVKATIRSRAQNLCEICGQHTSDLTAHHRRLKGMGGTRRPESQAVSAGIWVFALDHHRIHAHPQHSYEMGWLVKQSADPALIAVLRRERWVLLQDDGSFIEEAA